MKAHEPDDGQGGEAQLYHRLGAGRAWRRILATAFTFGVGPLLGLLTTLFPSITDFVVSWLQPSSQAIE